MPSGWFEITVALLIAALFVSYAVYMKQYLAGVVARAEARGAKRMRTQVAAMLNRYADDAAPAHRSVYVVVACNVSNLPLYSNGNEWRRS